MLRMTSHVPYTRHPTRAMFERKDDPESHRPSLSLAAADSSFQANLPSSFPLHCSLPKIGEIMPSRIIDAFSISRYPRTGGAGEAAGRGGRAGPLLCSRSCSQTAKKGGEGP